MFKQMNDATRFLFLSNQSGFNEKNFLNMCRSVCGYPIWGNMEVVLIRDDSILN